MGRAWCLLPEGAQALVGVPTGPDTIHFNGCRIYGNLMYSHLFANWKQIFTLSDKLMYSELCPWCYQPLHILEK